jgi:prepilin-type processing-associated H-X9-DG protein
MSQLTAPSKTVVFCEVQNCSPFNIATDYKQPYSPNTNGYGAAYNPQGAGTASQVLLATGYMRNISTNTSSDPYTIHFTGPLGRHSNGSNFVMADGHVKWMMPGSVCAGGVASLPTNCASGGTAAGTACSDTTIAATFSTM